MFTKVTKAVVVFLLAGQVPSALLSPCNAQAHSTATPNERDSAAVGRRSPTEKASPVYDGNWWLAASAAERLGFLYALDDCFSYDTQPKLVFRDTWQHDDERLSAYFGEGEHRSILVQAAFLQFGQKASSSDSEADGERYGDEFWRSHDDGTRTGYIEGFISCQHTVKPARRWMKPVSFYVGELNRLYNADDHLGEDAPEYDGSVASAMNKLE